LAWRARREAHVAHAHPPSRSIPASPPAPHPRARPLIPLQRHRAPAAPGRVRSSVAANV
jgi:hypothetical protein